MSISFGETLTSEIRLRIMHSSVMRFSMQEMTIFKLFCDRDNTALKKSEIKSFSTCLNEIYGESGRLPYRTTLPIGRDTYIRRQAEDQIGYNFRITNRLIWPESVMRAYQK